MLAIRGLPFNIQGGGQGYWDGTEYFFQYDPAHGYFFPAVRLTNYLLFIIYIWNDFHKLPMYYLLRLYNMILA